MSIDPSGNSRADIEASDRFCFLRDLVYAKSPLQKKMISSFLSGRDALFWQRANMFADTLLPVAEQLGIEPSYIVDSYLKMCHDMLVEQIKYRRTGRYSRESAAEAYSEVYQSKKVMEAYMLGLAISQFFWPNHYAMYDFFISESGKLGGVNKYLEVGPGHGLYLVESLKLFGHASFFAVDLSPISIQLAVAMTKAFVPDRSCRFLEKNVNTFDSGKDRFDYIVMCEVLEHLDCPLLVLDKLRSLLTDGGRLFITTCSNCPAIDHVYHFKSVDHIRQMIRNAGLQIISEIALPVQPDSDGSWNPEADECNYAAMLYSGNDIHDRL
ncbi:class I SAM-dependent methyltransferase [bacterium]|nr:class I SAM-dependent methyltransferase [bacterium]